MACCRSLTLLLLHLLLVELKFPSLENIAIATARLSWTGGNASKNFTGVEHISDLGIDDSLLGVGLNLGGDVSGLLSLLSGLVALLNFFLVQLDVVVLKIPESEWVRINFNNAVLDDGVGTHKLVVCSVVDDFKHSGLSCDAFGSPSEGSVVDFESPPFEVASTASNWSNSGWAKLSHGWLSTHLELSLLLMNWHTATSGPSLVS